MGTNFSALQDERSEADKLYLLDLICLQVADYNHKQ